MDAQQIRDEDASRKHFGKPHSGRHPIPTVQRYRRERKELRGQMEEEEEAQRGPEDQSKPRRAFESAKAVLKGEDNPQSSDYNPFVTTNRNHPDRPTADDGGITRKQQDLLRGTGHDFEDLEEDESDHSGKHGHGKHKDDKTATEAVAKSVDPKEKRKAMKKTKRHGGGREVTDPVTHLPIVIHDHTEKDLNHAPQNKAEPGTHHRTATGIPGASKSQEELDDETGELQRVHDNSRKLFPPPEFDYLKQELANAQKRAVIAGVSWAGACVIAALLLLVVSGAASGTQSATGAIITSLGVAALLAMGGFGLWTCDGWASKKAGELLEDEIWHAARVQEEKTVNSDEELPESVQWLNSLFSSIWPLINPDLFSSLVDMIEDVMQASLPKAVKMVSIDDMGQGSESVRILGIRWLPTGAASQAVNADGQLQKAGDQGDHPSDRTDPDNSTNQNDKPQSEKQDQSKPNNSSQTEQEESSTREGMEAEEGDFVNMELALSYRSRTSGKSIKSKAKNAHLYLKFYLPGGIAVPVWVELKGLIATARVRLQLTPDPPFVSLCTLTFLGQPRASLSCVPLSKHSLNLMNVPLLSSFVQSAIDAALAEYVAPKSLTLNLKDMLVGEDYKKNTTSVGVVWLYIKQARGFKEGDGGIAGAQGSSDSYVTVSWGKFGKPVASTRVIVDEQAPNWHEAATILVTTEEINAEEKLRLQLWDSDKWTADDDLGRVEIDLKELMRNSESRNRLQDREDGFVGEDPDEKLPGSLVWSVGFFTKTRISDSQLKEQKVIEEIENTSQLEEHVSKSAEHKLREAGKKADDSELKQQRAEDYRELEDDMLISVPPSQEHVSGILSVQIHNITGLGVQKLRKRDNDSDAEDEQNDEGGELPDSYCSVIINHQKVYKTRTKPKNSKPFFNAGTERFIRDWRNCEVIVSVRDSRDGESDPLIGIVYLPLQRIFANCSQVMHNYPLVGGIGFGRARISLVWRSVELKLPKNLAGWDFGTLEVLGSIKAKTNLPSELHDARIKLRTNIGKAKMLPATGDGESGHAWKAKQKKKQRREGEEPDNVFLAVRKRYASCLMLEFRESKFGPDSTPAFAVIWLNKLADEEEQIVTLKVWKGSKDNIKRAESCCDYAGGDGSKENGKEGAETEEPLGEIEMTVRFWRGLSGYHKKYAIKSKSSNMRSVMECLDTVDDEGLSKNASDSGEESEDDSSSSDDDSIAERKKKLRVRSNNSNGIESDSDDSDGDGGLNNRATSSLTDFKRGIKTMFRNPVDGATEAVSGLLGAGGKNDPDDGSRGARAQVRDYRDHHRQLHRKHRGIMQWRAARKADHIGGKVAKFKGSVGRMFEHEERSPGVETEV